MVEWQSNSTMKQLNNETIYQGNNSTMKEQITYLVANYNNGKYIKECLDSLNRQTNPHWLAIVCDDKSTDDSLAIIQPLLSDKIRLIQNEANRGYIGALKRLIANATTDIVGILDADDMLLPQATEAILRAYAQHPESGFIFSNHVAFSSEYKFVPKIGGSVAIPVGQTALTHGWASHLKTFRIRAYQQTPGLDEAILYAEDRDLAYKLEEVTRPVFVNQVLYKYRLVRGSQGTAPDKTRIGYRSLLTAQMNAVRRRKMKGIRRICHYLFFYCAYVSATSRSTVLKRLAGKYVDRLRRHIAAQNAKENFLGQSPEPVRVGQKAIAVRKKNDVRKAISLKARLQNFTSVR
jgi:glycosyltransferase involved in cell wall biosynthesis